MNFDQAQISVTLRRIAKNHLINARAMSGHYREIALQCACDARNAAFHVRNYVGPMEMISCGLSFSEHVQYLTACNILRREA